MSINIVREKPRYRTPDPTDSFCYYCQQWIRHRPTCKKVDCACGIHTCYNRGDLRGADGERMKCLIIAFSRVGRKTHLAWARYFELTAERALCGIGPVDLSIDRAEWPYDVFPKNLCKPCLDIWVRGPEYRDFA